ncbi:MAG: RNA polymerase sigma factor [Pyrinomonadaceae bacterium]
MNSESPRRPIWRLNQGAFERLLLTLSPDRDAAGEEYLRLRRNLVRFFETRGFAVADEAADDVLNRLARKLESGDAIENISTYALGVARMVVLELRKSPLSKITSGIPENIEAKTDSEHNEKENTMKCLDHCLNALPEENRDLILKYYQGEKREKIESRQRLAGQMGIAQNALRNRAVRLRDKLELCISDCMKQH